MAIQEAAAMRVTQAGRQMAISQTLDGDLRVTQLGRQVILPKPTPSVTSLLSPVDSETYTLSINVVYTESTDPLGGTITYTYQYKSTASGTWLTEFTGRSGTDVYIWDVSGLADGDYDVRIYATATGGTGEDSAPFSATITIDNTSPGPPNITAPYEGQEWVAKNFQTVEWEAASDPNDLSLTYKIDYKTVAAGSWTPVTTGLTTLSYDWDISALAADDYQVRVYANNGTVDGEADIQGFTVVAADQPITPAIRVVAVDEQCVTLELSEYDHPTPRAWASTTWVLYPVGGSSTNPIVSYTTTDPAEQSKVTLCDLPSGFYGLAFAYYTDNAANDSNNSATVEFTLGDFSRRFVPRWDDSAVWVGGGPGEQSGQNERNAGYAAQPTGASVLVDAGTIGSVHITGYVMLSGCNCGWIGRDTELRSLGIGIYNGFTDDNTDEGIDIRLRAGVGTSAGAGTQATLTATLDVDVRYADGTTSYASADVGGMMAQLIAGYTNTIGSPIGNWATSQNRDPWYQIEALIQRDMTPGANTVRIRAKVYRAVGFGDFSDELLEPVPEGEWHIDVTYNKEGPCGYPGYSLMQEAFAWNSARNYFRGLDFTYLRDLGLDSASTVTQPGYTGPAAPGTCTPQAEAALPTPVFFPIPPNGNVTERVLYPTDVIETWNDSEQRISLRERAVRAIGWTGTVLTSQEASDLAAMLYEDQPSRWIVPLWQDASPLLVDLAGSSSSIPAASVDTEDRRFEGMTHVALWVDQFTWHVSEAVLEDDGSITLTTQTTDAFTGGLRGPTFVLPCRVGRMPQSIEASRAAPFVSETTYEFILEGVND